MAMSPRRPAARAGEDRRGRAASLTLQAGEAKVSVAARKTLPSWSIYGAKDLAIPPAALAFMAERAHARKIQVVSGPSHVVMVPHPHEVALMIEQAAAAAK